MMKPGDRVYLKFKPSDKGTVTVVTAASFRVTWDFPGRKRGEPRQRYSYPLSFAGRFGHGETED